MGGVKSIGNFAQVAVPVMAGADILIALAVILLNPMEFLSVIGEMFRSAFGVAEAGAGAGALGAVIAAGIKRGLFSNEAGMGSSPNAAAAADVAHPAQQGYVQMASVFLDTMMICTATAGIVLMGGVDSDGAQGVTLTQESLSAVVGGWGSHFIAIALMFFAFTSIIANYYYAETSVYYLSHKHVVKVTYRVLYAGFIIFGAMVASSGSSEQFALIWSMADVSMGLMASVNLLAIVLLSSVAFKVVKHYEDKVASGDSQPHFSMNDCPVKGRVSRGIWGA